MAGIYIHIPFCKKACHYCNFHFSTSTALINDFLTALVHEVTLQKNYLGDEVETIYFGGGTPSLLPMEGLQRIFDVLQNTFAISTQAEITLEANPDDITVEKLAQWKQAGINRLSLGVQSFFEEDLRWMNRAHNASQAEQSIGWAQQAGFNNITIDLIYGTPTLSEAGWVQNLHKAFQMGVQHLSCYALTVEPKTALEVMIRQKKVPQVNTAQQAKHFDLLVSETGRAGFEQYEISNFALPGFRSRHNSNYWLGKHYLGLGPSAHSYNGHSRQWNVANNALYIESLKQGSVPNEEEILTRENQLNEYLMTSLRTIEGVDMARLKVEFGSTATSHVFTAAARYINDGKIKIHDDHLVLTVKGKFFADGIAADLFQL